METQRPIVVFDGVCNFCNRAVNFILANDAKEEILFAPRQSAPGQEILGRFGLPEEGIGSMLLVEGERLSTKSTAVLRVARRLRFPWNLAWAFSLVPAFIRDVFYDWFAANRYRWAGKSQQCRMPTEQERARFLGG